MAAIEELDFSVLDAEYAPEEVVDQSPLVELQEGEVDPRFLRVSYSGLLDLHACPRLFQLNKLGAEVRIDLDSSLTFAYGHAIGGGTQELFISGDVHKAIWNMFVNWPMDLLAVDEKRKKSFAHAVAAIQQLDSMRKQGFLGGYEIAEYDGKPAAELSFRVRLPYGAAFRGYADLVLRNVYSGQALVLEEKTDSANYVLPAKYKNSAQAIGYSVLLDKIESGSSDYSVQYLINMTKLERWEEFQFPKSYHQRALWLRDVVYDVEEIVRYVKREGNYGIWPMRGESCTRFGKACAHMDTCQLETVRQTQPLREKHYKDTSRDGVEAQYQFDLTLEELLAHEIQE